MLVWDEAHYRCVTSGDEHDEDPSFGHGFSQRGELTGKLLVASPRLSDPSFTRSVVLMLDHGPAGALGLVLNRPTGVPVNEILPLWHDQATKFPPAFIFSGGPVTPSAVIGLVRAPDAGEPIGWHPVLAEVGTVDLSIAPENQPAPLEGVRLFSGYAGWSAQQLDDEIQEGAWFSVEGIGQDLFGDDPERLWHDVLKRQGGELGLLATYPPNPSVN
jgi:putative transcriptional regulator